MCCFHLNRVQTVTTFGFRGEALSAMCALAELSIVTRTSGEGAQDCRVRVLGSSDQGVQDSRAQMPCPSTWTLARPSTATRTSNKTHTAPGVCGGDSRGCECGVGYVLGFELEIA